MNIPLEPAMHSIIPVTALLVLIAWSEGSIIIDLPGLGPPPVHRGVK